jgi:hypothetical protein
VLALEKARQIGRANDQLAFEKLHFALLLQNQSTDRLRQLSVVSPYYSQSRRYDEAELGLCWVSQAGWAELKLRGPLPTQTLNDLAEAHRRYAEVESRDFVYPQASILLEHAMQPNASGTMGAAIAILLQSWNHRFYTSKGIQCDQLHVAKIDALLELWRPHWLPFRARNIESLAFEDLSVIEVLFGDFDGLVGHVGAAKALHLVAPRFFPLWDNPIANGYGLHLRKGSNGATYVNFMKLIKNRISDLGGANLIERQVPGISALKALDEWNYCEFTVVRDEALRRQPH